MLFFDSKLLRGNRATKQASDRPDAYSSPNFPRLGSVRRHMEIRSDLVLPQPKGSFKVASKVDNSITVLSLAPGFDDRLIIEYAEYCAASERPSALVLMLYGTGGSPTKKAVLYDALRRATDNGAIVVCCSQCPYGRIDFGQYAVGNQWIDSGAIAGADMTVEAITGKLGYLLGKGLTTAQIKQAMQTNIRGERTDFIYQNFPLLHQI